MKTMNHTSVDQAELLKAMMPSSGQRNDQNIYDVIQSYPYPGPAEGYIAWAVTSAYSTHQVQYKLEKVITELSKALTALKGITAGSNSSLRITDSTYREVCHSDERSIFSAMQSGAAD